MLTVCRFSSYNTRCSFRSFTNQCFLSTKRYFFNTPNVFSVRHPVDLSLYLVTERKCIKNDEEFFSKTMKAIEGGVSCVQLRDDNENLQTSLKTAYRLKDMMKHKGIPLIINNRLDVALAVKAEGVHLGQKDFPYRDARHLMGRKAIIGLTVDTLEDVQTAESLDVDYLAVQLFPSKNTKPNHIKTWGIKGLKEIQSLTRHRLVVIGGINLDNLETICSQIQLGQQKDGIAMVGELWRGNNPYETARKIQAVFNRMTITCQTNKT